MLVLLTAVTGMLEPAARTLLERGDRVLVVGRSAERVHAAFGAPAGLLVAEADWTDEAALARALSAHPPPDAALLYLPELASDAGAAVRSAAAGVELLPSAYAGPADDGAALRRWRQAHPGLRPLVLGWHAPTARENEARWHTPREISTAAVSALDGPDQASSAPTLGAVRPWTQHP